MNEPTNQNKQADKDCLTTGQANGATSNRRSAPLRCVEYLTDDGPDPLDGGDGPHYLVVRIGGNGDIYIGTRAAGERVPRTVRFRMANGGASAYPRLCAAVRDLASALSDVSRER